MQTHIVPVGFDYDRLIAPLVRDQIDVDSVILLEGPSAARPTSSTLGISKKLETDFENLLGARTGGSSSRMSTTTTTPSSRPTRLITAELDSGNEVWVNVAAMPRTVSFAFANAAHSLMVERQEDRGDPHLLHRPPRSTSRRNWPRSFANRSPCSRTWTRDRTRRSAIATASTMTASTATGSTSASRPPRTSSRSSTSAGRRSVRRDRRQSHRRVARRLLLERQAIRGAHPVQTRRGRRVRLRLGTGRIVGPRVERGIYGQLPIEGHLQRRPPRARRQGVHRTGGTRQILPNPALADRRTVGTSSLRRRVAVAVGSLGGRVTILERAAVSRSSSEDPLPEHEQAWEDCEAGDEREDDAQPRHQPEPLERRRERQREDAKARRGRRRAPQQRAAGTRDRRGEGILERFPLVPPATNRSPT